MNIAKLLTKRREDLATIDHPYQRWKDVKHWYAGLKPILLDQLSRHVESFDRLINREWPHTPVIEFDNGVSVHVDTPHGHMTKANEAAAVDTQRELLSILDALIDLQPFGEREQESSSGTHDPISNRVFLVHGHDDKALHETARFFQLLELVPVILREQPNKGRTIIEKFENYSDVSFAVILLTGDDRGGTKDQPLKQQSIRARQNVILELGFFLGKLGRTRVCALYEDRVEIPSDYDGVVFVPYDSNGGWHLKLAREMKAAQLSVDMNKVV